jgi:hypothetical protein
LRLQAENQKNHPVFMSIQMSDGSRRIKLKIGGRHGNPLKIYLKLNGMIDSEHLFQSLLNSTKLTCTYNFLSILHKLFKGYEFTLISFFLSFLFKRRQHKKMGPLVVPNKDKIINKNLFFEKFKSFNNEANQFWERIKCEYSFSVERDDNYLNWKYVDQPHMQYEKFYVRENNEVVGLFVFRIGQPPELKVGVVAEILASKKSSWIFNEILEFIDNHLISRGVLMIRCASSIEALDKILQNRGYQIIEYKVPVINIDKKSTNISYQDIKKKDWLMSLGDQDIDIPLLNQQPSFVDFLKIIKGEIPGKQFLDTTP